VLILKSRTIYLILNRQIPMFATTIIIWGSNQPLRKVEPKQHLRKTTFKKG
jgi:hypothetical protein